MVKYTLLPAVMLTNISMSKKEPLEENQDHSESTDNFGSTSDLFILDRTKTSIYTYVSICVHVCVSINVHIFRDLPSNSAPAPLKKRSLKRKQKYWLAKLLFF